MKRFLYIVLLGAAVLLPPQGTDVGKLIPVEVIAVSQRNDSIYIETDTGDTGEGKDLHEALDRLKSTSPGVIYLDTAEYLLLEPEAENVTAQLRMILKGNIKVCRAAEGIPLEGIAEYMSVHKPGIRLDEVTSNIEIPVIYEENGRYQIVGK